MNNYIVVLFLYNDMWWYTYIIIFYVADLSGGRTGQLAATLGLFSAPHLEFTPGKAPGPGTGL